MSDQFSARHGYTFATDVEITIRDDAPQELRTAVAYIAYESGLGPKLLRKDVCQVLRVEEDRNNWTEFPNIDEEVRYHLETCKWFRVYDIIERIYSRLNGYAVDEEQASGADDFEKEINGYFREHGIGWQLNDGRVEVRGLEHFEAAVRGAATVLMETERETAGSELREAMLDMSRRPKADVTGAVQHSIAALECVARDITGDTKASLGQIITRNPGFLPKPLDQAVAKAWGYASNMGRHLQEGSEPDFEDAELVVSISAAVCRYLITKEKLLNVK